MAGPGAFWCNSPAVTATEACARRFVIMGFNYERGVDCMLENFGHRTESIMSQVYQGYRGERNRWEHFCRHEQATSRSGKLWQRALRSQQRQRLRLGQSARGLERLRRLVQLSRL